MRKQAQVRTTITLTKELAEALETQKQKKDTDLSKLIRCAVRFWIFAGCPEAPVSAGAER
jgi:hypothetical protein